MDLSFNSKSSVQSSDASIRILIAGDNPNIAQTLSLIIQNFNSNWVVSTTHLSPQVTINQANILRPDIIIMDLKMNKPDTIRIIRDTVPNVRLICLAPTKDFKTLYAAMQFGISGYFIQPFDTDELLNKLQTTSAEIIAQKERSLMEMQMQDRIETASRIIQKDYIKALTYDTGSEYQFLSYAHYLGLAELTGFVIAIMCRKKPTYKLPETIIYRLSKQFDIIGSSVQKGLGVALIPAEQKTEATQDHILQCLDDLLCDFSLSGEDMICGIGSVRTGALPMKTSLQEAQAALSNYGSVYTPFARCILFDPKTMTLSSEPSAEPESGERPLPPMKGSLEQAIRYMEKHFHRELTLAEVAASVNLSPCYFSRNFKKYTGENFSAFLLRLRINKAKELLADPNNSIKKVAYQTGFQDAHYFSKVFHKFTGTKASEYSAQQK